MIRGQKRVFPRPDLNLDINASIHNRFDIEVVDSTTGKVKQLAQAENVICSNLWKYLFASPWRYFNCISYGDGEGTPSSADTQLFSHVGSVAATFVEFKVDKAKGVAQNTKRIVLSTTDAVGKTLTEVGISYSTTATTLCTHAMLKDMNGNPISIEKTDTDIVNIYATVFAHYDVGGYGNGCIFPWHHNEWTPNGSVNNANSILLLPWLCGNYAADSYGSNIFNKVQVSPYNGYAPKVSASGNDQYLAGAAVVGATKTFDVSSKKVVITSNRVEPSVANFGGIKTLAIASGSYSTPMLIIQLGDWYPNTRIENESIGTGDGVTSDFALNFGCAHDVTILVDGIPAEISSVEYAPISTTYWWAYMVGLHPESTPDNHIKVFDNAGGCVYPYQPKESKYFYNPFHQIGISKMGFYGNGAKVWASTDFSSWVEIGEGTNISVGETYQKYPYWKYQARGDYLYFTSMTPGSYNSKVVHLVEPPAEGAAITASYTTDTIAKDANHVFDLSVTIQLGEYNEA